jgi:hypothetical protein
MTELNQRHHCCKMGCDKEAEYTIYENRAYHDDYIESCLEHIPDLLPCGDLINLDRIKSTKEITP